PRSRPAERRHRAGRRLADVEDAALDVSRLPRLEGRQRPDRQGDRAAARALRRRLGEGRRADDRRSPPRGDPRRAHPADGRRPPLGSRRMGRFVYEFDEPSSGGRELLGGKGMGLAEMTLMGLPVPAGFTISTDACRAYMKAGELPAGLAEEVAEHVGRLEQTTGKRFGDPGDPLLVSVRSGAAVSMPGMMDTILNLGLNDEAAEGLAARTGNRRFAFDSYRRLLQMFGEVVDGIDPHRFEDPL